MARPPRTTPTAPQTLGGGLTPGQGPPAQVTVQRPDLNASWRGLMSGLGVGLPHGLNRAVKVTHRLHRAVR